MKEPKGTKKRAVLDGFVEGAEVTLTRKEDHLHVADLVYCTLQRVFGTPRTTAILNVI